MAIVWLVLGFVLLAGGAEIMVRGAVSLSEHLRIPPLVIGLTVVAFGTSAPEAAVGIRASLEGANEILLGNVIGSNILNVLLVLGLCALVAPLKVRLQTVVKETPFVLLATVVLLVMAWDRRLGTGPDMLSRGDALVLLAFFAVYLYATLEVMFLAREEDKARMAPEMGLPLSLVMLAGGLAAVVGGSVLAVSGARTLALALGMSEIWVGMTVVALGTSLPEIVTSVAAVRQGQTDLAVGNVVGSNAFNILFILGVSGLIRPVVLTPVVLLDLWVAIGSLVLLMVFMWTGRIISRREGSGMLGLYVLYVIWMTVR